MKRLISIIAVLLSLFCVAGCAAGQPPIGSEPEPPLEGNSQMLVVYFSYTGNTQKIAEFIGEATESEMFRILTVVPYPDDINECYEVGQKELNENARPELSQNIAPEVFARYDTVFIGYPIWGGTMPMAVYTFLESQDFTGKTVIPFCTHGGSGICNTEREIEETCGEVTMLDGFSISGSRAEGAKASVENWLQDINILQ